MKKFFAILLCVCMAFAIVACAPVEENKEADYKLGMGIVVSTDSSKTGTAQVDATVATVVTDADGKIVLCRVDVAQNKFALETDFTNTEKKFETKKELKERYNMAAYGSDNNGDGVVLEWYKQAEAFETFVVGKTVADLETLKNNTQEVNAHHITTNEELLAAGCTMEIGDFCEAAIKACNDEQGMSFKAVAGTFTLGVAAKSTAAESVAPTAEKDGTVAMYTDFAASVVVDGKIVATLNDAIQPKITVNTAGEVTPNEFKGTKRELKEDYNMVKFGSNLDNNGDGKVLEWYVQSAAFSNYVVGKTGAEVAGMKTVAATQGSVGYMISADADLLAAGCTIQIGAICAVVAQSVTNAR
jgi:hypothetical protein